MFLVNPHPTPKQPRFDFYHCKSVLPILYINGLFYNAHFCVWNLFFNTTFLRFLYVVCMSTDSYFLCWVVVHYRNVSEFVYLSSCWGTFGFFPGWTIMNIPVQVFCGHIFSFLMRYIFIFIEMERSSIVSEDNFVLSYLTELDIEKRIYYIFEIKYLIVEQHIHASNLMEQVMRPPLGPQPRNPWECVYTCVQTAHGHTQAQAWAMVKWKTKSVERPGPHMC